MLDTNLLPYPWHVMVLAVIGLVVCCVIAWYVLMVVWALVKATLQAFIYQLFIYKRAKLNGRSVNHGIFWKSWRDMWFFLLGSDYSKDPIRRGNSFFYGWTFTVRKDSQFVPKSGSPTALTDDLDDDDI